MKKRFTSIILALVMLLSIVNIPKQVKAESIFLTDAMAEQFVKILCNETESTEEGVIGFLTGETEGTEAQIKVVLEGIISAYGLVIDTGMIDEYVQLFYAQEHHYVNGIFKLATSALDIFENAHSMINSDIALQKTVDAFQIGVSVLDMVGWGEYLPPTLGLSFTAIELALKLGGLLQTQYAIELVQVNYVSTLMIQYHTGQELSSPINAVIITNEVGITQKEIDALCSKYYSYYKMKQILDALPISNGSYSPSIYTFTITYNSNCAEVDNITKTYSSSENPIIYPVMTRPKYVFKGFAWDSEGIEMVETLTPEDHTLYAIWETYNYTITFDSNCDEVENIIKTYNSLEEPIEFPSMARPGYVFIDYAYDPEGKEMVGSTFIGKDQTFYAIWETYNYTITYDSNCNEVDDIIKTYNSLEENIIYPSMTRPKYKFVGYAYDPEGKEMVGNTFLSKNQTFYAIWKLDIRYSVQNNEAIITGCSKDFVDLEIPDVIDGYLVTGIADNAFKDYENLKSISIPSSVKTIGERAFENCSGLTNIFIPDGVTIIGDSAFIGCSNLLKITLPNKITAIGSGVFSGCKSLEKLIIPNGVTRIGSTAFALCSNLTEITMPDSVTNIGMHAFHGCSNLTEIILPDSVRSIGVGAFSRCSSLKFITIPKYTAIIGERVFEGCISLIGINIDKKNGTFSSVEGVLFDKKKSNLVAYPCGKENNKYIVPDSVTTISNYAFMSCDNLTHISLQNGVAKIGTGAFRSCSKLESIAIPKDVSEIGKNIIENCSSLKTIIYNGSQEDWNKISINTDNTELRNATKYYNCKYNSDNMFITNEGIDTSAYITLDENYIGKTVVLALYNDGELADVSIKTYDGNMIEIPSKKEHDEIKLMLWNDRKTLVPLCEAEVVKTTDWKNS